MFTPGMPIPLSEADVKHLENLLQEELEDALQEHSATEEKIDRWTDAYRAKPITKVKDFPWPNACNVVIPLIGIAVDSIVARIVNTIYSVNPFWTVRPLKKEFETFAKPVESGMEWSRINEFDMYRQTRKWVPDIVLYGCGYMKTVWETRTVRQFRPNAFGEPEMFERVVRRPFPHHVPIKDIIPQAGVVDEINGADWIAHRFRLTDGQLRARSMDAGWDNVEDVIANKEAFHADVNSASSVPGVYESGSSLKERLNTFYEVWGNLPPYAGSTEPEPVVLTFHRPTGKLKRAIYNPMFNCRWAFSKALFVEDFGNRLGSGIAAKLADLQDEITTLHRQQVDNGTIANTRFFVGRRGVVKPNTRIWPGRFLTTPDPERDIKVLQMGDIYNSMRALSTEILAFAERSSGVSDPFLGRESSVVGTRATATGTLAIIQEGNRRFDLNVRDIRDALGDIGRLVLELNHQFRPRGFFTLVQGEDGQYTESILELPPEFTASALAVELTASTATINRDVERQGLISLLGLLSQYYDRLIQISMIIQNPQLPAATREMAAKMADGAKFIMERLLQTFDVKDIDAVLPVAMEEMQNGPGGPSGFGAGGQSVPSMGGVPQPLEGREVEGSA